MTACNNVQDANLGKKAVSAALAGTLAVGMVPAAALAAEAPRGRRRHHRPDRDPRR